MSNLAIRVEGLGKRYRIGARRERYVTLRETLARAFATPFYSFGSRGERGASARPSDSSGSSWGARDTTLWALRDVSFEVEPGEVVGIIGRNGAGKSTLLKVLSRITSPTEGCVQVWGRVGPLLEVGTGFHPELTGRDNIVMNGAILGMRRAEILRKFDEIVAFAEVEQFIDTPVKHYSDGMYLRLAFAVAAHLEPEILVVDEVLAVGDAAFQKKCLGKMGEVSSQGRTVLFVSHNLEAVTTLCQRGILLDCGHVRTIGTAREVVDVYLSQIVRDLHGSNAEVTYPETPALPAQILGVRVEDTSGQPALRHDLMSPIAVKIAFVIRRPFPNLLVACRVLRNDGHPMYSTYDVDEQNMNRYLRPELAPKEPGYYEASVTLPAPLLNTGLYELLVYLLNPRIGAQDQHRGILIEISDVDGGSFASFPTKRRRPGLLALPLKWHLTRTQL